MGEAGNNAKEQGKAQSKLYLIPAQPRHPKAPHFRKALSSYSTHEGKNYDSRISVRCQKIHAPVNIRVVCRQSCIVGRAHRQWLVVVAGSSLIAQGFTHSPSFGP